MLFAPDSYRTTAFAALLASRSIAAS